MSWIDRIENIKLQVITGDGESYYPLWRNAQKSIAYNTEGFDFVGVDGSLVERYEQTGNRYNVDFVFQGEDHIDVANAFELSAKNKNAWRIIHPIYDEILVHPVALEFDNSLYNSTQITGGIWETISDKFPDIIGSDPNLIATKKDAIGETNADIFEGNDAIDLSAENISKADLSNNKLYELYLKLTDNDVDISILKDSLRTASAGVSVITSDANYFMSQAFNLINFPFIIEQNIQFKINTLITGYNQIKDIFSNDADFYQSYSTSIMAVACACASSPDSDSYKSNNDVLTVIEQLDAMYYDIITTLDYFGYNEDSQLATDMDVLFTATIASLFVIAFDAQQERTIMLDKDDNMINLAHKYYGSGDDALEEFIDRNEVTLNEMLQLKKGRKITYYV